MRSGILIEETSRETEKENCHFLKYYINEIFGPNLNGI